MLTDDSTRLTGAADTTRTRADAHPRPETDARALVRARAGDERAARSRHGDDAEPTMSRYGLTDEDLMDAEAQAGVVETGRDSAVAAECGAARREEAEIVERFGQLAMEIIATRPGDDNDEYPEEVADSHELRTMCVGEMTKAIKLMIKLRRE